MRLFAALHSPLRPIDCLLFGALISPTDPISVLALLKQARAPEPLALSLSNDMPARSAILTMTYVVVVCSILLQGLKMAAMTRHWLTRTGQNGLVVN